MKPVFLAFAILLLPAKAVSVSVSSNGTGQVLIYPYYSTRHMDTVISVTNGSSRPKALKVVVREAKQGQAVLRFNLYIRGGDSWSALLGAEPDDRRPFVSTVDSTCTVPSILTQNDGLLPNGAPSVALRSNLIDDDPDVERRLGEGYVEIFEMGELTGDAAAFTNDQDCFGLHTAWIAPDGFWSIDASVNLLPPAGGLEGRALLVEAATGVSYDYVPVALKGFSVRQQHSEPTEVGESELSNANSSLETNGVLATVFTDQGGVDLLWRSGIEAVSAALSQASLAASYRISEALEISTDAILVFPTRRYFEDEAFAPADLPVPILPFRSTFSDERGAPTRVPVLIANSAGDVLIPPALFSVNLPWTVQVLNVSADPVLDSAFRVGEDVKARADGRMVLHFGESSRTGQRGGFAFDDARVASGPNQGMVARLGGLPVIGLRVERTLAGAIGTASGRQPRQPGGTVLPMTGDTDLQLP
ncbi:MAG: hypothetical protein AAF552_03095 [Pseudomonadota bacterium]